MAIFKVFWGKKSQNTWCFFLKFAKKLKINYFYPNQEVWGYSGCLNYEKLRLLIFLTNFRQFGLPRHPFFGSKELNFAYQSTLTVQNFFIKLPQLSHALIQLNYREVFRRRQKCSGGDKTLPASREKTDRGVFIVFWENMAPSSLYEKIVLNLGSSISILSNWKKTSFRRRQHGGGQTKTVPLCLFWQEILMRCAFFTFSQRYLISLARYSTIKLRLNGSIKIVRFHNAQVPFGGGVKCRLRNVNLSPPQYLVKIGKVTWKIYLNGKGIDGPWQNLS